MDFIRQSDRRPSQWWGAVWEAPAPRDLPALVADEFLSPAVAGLLAAAVIRLASIAVVAAPSGAGKTTLLTALVEVADPDHARRRVYPSGSFETFAFLNDPALDPAATLLLVNEISSHLPHYLWGPAVERLLRLGREGFQIGATAHAGDAREFVAMLAAPPLRIRPALAAAFDVVVALDLRREEGGIRRRVSGVWALAPGRLDSALILPLAAGDDTVDAISVRLEALRDNGHAKLATLTGGEIERVMTEPGVLFPRPPEPDQTASGRPNW